MLLVVISLCIFRENFNKGEIGVSHRDHKFYVEIPLDPRQIIDLIK
jgi:hypothetical protein